MTKGPIPPTMRFGMSCAEAAAYVGISRPHFERLVEIGRFPKPREAGGRIVWSRPALERTFEAPPQHVKPERSDAETRAGS